MRHTVISTCHLAFLTSDLPNFSVFVCSLDLALQQMAKKWSGLLGCPCNAVHAIMHSACSENLQFCPLGRGSISSQLWCRQEVSGSHYGASMSVLRRLYQLLIAHPLRRSFTGGGCLVKPVTGTKGALVSIESLRKGVMQNVAQAKHPDMVTRGCR